LNKNEYRFLFQITRGMRYFLNILSQNAGLKKKIRKCGKMLVILAADFLNIPKSPHIQRQRN